MPNMNSSKRARQQDSIKNLPTCGGDKKSGLMRFVGMDSSLSLGRFGATPETQPGLPCTGTLYTCARNQTCAGGVGKQVNMRHCGEGAPRCGEGGSGGDQNERDNFIGPRQILEGNEEGDSFGESYEITGDGKNLIVGAPGAKGENGDKTGVVYLYERDNCNEAFPDEPMMTIDPTKFTVGTEKGVEGDCFGSNAKIYKSDRLIYAYISAVNRGKGANTNVGAVYIFKLAEKTLLSPNFSWISGAELSPQVVYPTVPDNNIQYGTRISVGAFNPEEDFAPSIAIAGNPWYSVASDYGYVEVLRWLPSSIPPYTLAGSPLFGSEGSLWGASIQLTVTYPAQAKIGVQDYLWALSIGAPGYKNNDGAIFTRYFDEATSIWEPWGDELCGPCGKGNNFGREIVGDLVWDTNEEDPGWYYRLAVQSNSESLYFYSNRAAFKGVSTDLDSLELESVSSLGNTKGLNRRIQSENPPDVAVRKVFRPKLRSLYYNWGDQVNNIGINTAYNAHSYALRPVKKEPTKTKYTCVTETKTGISEETFVRVDAALPIHCWGENPVVTAKLIAEKPQFGNFNTSLRQSEKTIDKQVETYDEVAVRKDWDEPEDVGFRIGGRWLPANEVRGDQEEDVMEPVGVWNQQETRTGQNFLLAQPKPIGEGSWFDFIDLSNHIIETGEAPSTSFDPDIGCLTHVVGIPDNKNKKGTIALYDNKVAVDQVEEVRERIIETSNKRRIPNILTNIGGKPPAYFCPAKSKRSTEIPYMLTDNFGNVISKIMLYETCSEDSPYKLNTYNKIAFEIDPRTCNPPVLIGQPYNYTDAIDASPNVLPNVLS